MDNVNLFFSIFNLHYLYPALNQVIIFSTNYGVYLSFFLALLLAWLGGKKEKKAVILMIVSAIAAYLFVYLIKLFIHEPRPFITFNLQPIVSPPKDFSFPSGHATNMAVIAFSFLFARSKWAFLFFILMFWIGFTRIYVGVHYPLDVLGGFILGFVVTFVISFLANKIYKSV